MSGSEPDGNRLARESAKVGLNVGLLVASRIAGLAMSLVQIGLIFRALSLSGQGEFQAAFNFASLFMIFATLGIQRLLVRDIARSPGAAWAQVWTALSVVGVLSVLCLGVMYAIKRDSGTVDVVLWAGSYVVVCWAVQQPFEALLIARERMGLVAFLNILGGAFRLLAVWRWVPIPGAIPDFVVPPVYVHQVLAVANAAALGSFVFAAFAICGAEGPRLRPRAALAQIRACFPFFLAMLCSWVYFKSDMELLHYFRGGRDAGIYAPVQKLTEPLLMVAALWGTAIFPALCRLSHTDTAGFAHVKATSLRLALLAACPMAVGLALLAEPIILLLAGGGEGVAASARVLQIVALILPLFYLNGIGQEFLYASGRNAYVVWTYFAAAVASVGLNLWAIPAHGVIGLAWVAVGANLLVSVLFCIGMRREIAFGNLAQLLWRTAIACGLMGAVALYGASFNLYLGVAGGIVVYLAVQAALGTLDDDERAMVRQIVGTRRSEGCRPQ